MISFIRKYRRAGMLLGTFVIFSLLAIFITYPLVFHMGSLVTGYGDELVIAWIQNSVIHSLTTNPLGLFNATILYPYHNTLAYSDLFIPTSIMAIPIVKLIDQPIVTFNFTFISSLALLGFSLFILSYYLTQNYVASLLSGILVMFSPVVLDKKVHLQILSLEWIPFSLVFFLIFMKQKQTRYLVLSCFFFLAQTYNSFLPGYFLIIFYAVYLMFQWLYARRELSIFLVKKHLAIILLTAALIVPITIPYFQVSHQFGAIRDVRDTIHFAIQPEDLLYGNDQTRLQPLLLAFATSRHYPKNAEIKTGYLGLMFSLLVIFTLVYVIKQEKKRDRMLMIFTSTGLFGLLLSFGPYMHWGRLTIHKPFPIPLPYLFFYYLAPGFQGFRNSARWEMLFVLCMSISIALVLSKLEESWKKRVKKTIHRFSWYGIYLVLIFGIIAEYHFPMQFLPAPQRKDFPRIYQFLASTDKMTPVIFLPIYNWNSPYALEEIKREYYSLSEFHPMVNGYSGYSPPPWQKFIAQMNTFPDTSTLQEIRNKGVKDIIVNTSEYDRLEASQHSSRSGEQIIEALRQKDSVLLVKQLGDTYIFTFTR